MFNYKLVQYSRLLQQFLVSLPLRVSIYFTSFVKAASLTAASARILQVLWAANEYFGRWFPSRL
jgi:hypothetical protein